MFFSNKSLLFSCGINSCLIADIFQIGPREPRSQITNNFENFLNFLRIDFDPTNMNLKYLLSGLSIGKTNVNISVESAGSGKGRIERLLKIGRCKNDHFAVLGETVHGNEELIEGVFSLDISEL